MDWARPAHSLDMKRFASLILVPLAALVACGGSTTNLGNDATNDGGPGPTSTSSSSSSSGTLPDNDAGSPSEMDGTVGVVCGRITASQPPSFFACPPGQYCDQKPGKCHAISACKTISVPPWNGQCTALVPSCGCDGKDYCNAEHAEASGTSIAMPGSCEFDCGPKRCNALNQYCEHGSGGAPPPDGGPPFEQWECRTYPAKCLSSDDQSCACLKAQGVSDVCSIQNGHVRTELFFP